jgi:hypothetical protein
MATLFVSHSSTDQAATERVGERLRAEGVAALFIDFDPEQGIPAGRNWERELYAQVRKVDAMVFLSSPASVGSQWCLLKWPWRACSASPSSPSSSTQDRAIHYWATPSTSI